MRWNVFMCEVLVARTLSPVTFMSHSQRIFIDPMDEDFSQLLDMSETVGWPGGLHTSTCSRGWSRRGERSSGFVSVGTIYSAEHPLLHPSPVGVNQCCDLDGWRSIWYLSNLPPGQIWYKVILLSGLRTNRNSCAVVTKKYLIPSAFPIYGVLQAPSLLIARGEDFQD